MRLSWDEVSAYGERKLAVRKAWSKTTKQDEKRGIYCLTSSNSEMGTYQGNAL